jgi:hypothetical protein
MFDALKQLWVKRETIVHWVFLTVCFLVTSRMTVFLLYRLAGDPGMTGLLLGVGLMLESIKVYGWHKGWRDGPWYIAVGSVSTIITFSVFLVALQLNMSEVSSSH